MMSTSIPAWAELTRNEKLRDDNLEDYQNVKWEDTLTEPCTSYAKAAHGMIWAKLSGSMWNKEEKKHAAILMQMRFDGRIGFPGGFIDKGPCEDIVDGLNRELVEEIALDVARFSFNQSHHMLTTVNHKRKLCLHFYAQEVSIEDFTEIEASQTKAVEWGMETFGTLRVPLFMYKQQPGKGFPAFLTNTFAGNCKYQLIHTIQKHNIVPPEDLKILMEAYLNYV